MYPAGGSDQDSHYYVMKKPTGVQAKKPESAVVPQGDDSSAAALPAPTAPKPEKTDVKSLADKVCRGLLAFSAEEWTESVGALMNALKSANSAAASDAQDDAKERMHLKLEAAKEVARTWKLGPDNDGVLEGLFSAATDFPKVRRSKFESLVAFAQDATQTANRLLWKSKSADPLAASIRHA
jgi:hypothetical protein